MQFDDDQRDTVLNSRLIVEVLSKSTEAYDRGRKFAQYRQIERELRRRAVMNR